MSFHRLDDGTLEVRYTPTRAEVWRFYGVLWKRALWKLHLVLIPTFWVYLLALTLLDGRPDYGLATVGVLLVWASMPLYPLIRFRSGERSLRIRQDGVSVTIDGKTRSKPWNRFARLEEDGEHLFLFGHRFNAFIVAKRSFASPAEAEEFAAATRALIPARRK